MEGEPQVSERTETNEPIKSGPEVQVLTPELPQTSTTEQEEQELNNQIAVQNLQQQADLQVVSQNVTTELQNQEQVYEQVWKPILNNRTHQKLETVYHRISPEGVVFFDVLDQEEFIAQTEKNF